MGNQLSNDGGGMIMWFSVLKTDAEDKAMQFIEEAVESLSYAKIVDNEIWLTPNWLKDDIPNIGHIHLSPTNREIERFIIKLDNVNNPKLCVYFNFTHNDLEHLLCLKRGTNPNNAVPADSYVTVMMLMGNKEEFLRLWD